MDKQKLIDLYKIHNTLTNVAKEIKLSVESTRQLFIKNKIDYSKRSKYKLNEDFFKEENELSFYWAGFIYGDGCIEQRKNNSRLRIQLKKSDENHLKLLINDLKSNHNINYNKYKESRPNFKKEYYESAILKISSSTLTNDLKSNFNIYPNKTKTIFIKENILNSKLFNHFLRGLIDADGSFDLKSHKMSLALNKNTLNNIVLIFKNLNIKYYIQKRSETLYVLCVSKYSEILKLINYVYNDSTRFLQRKKNIVDNILKLDVKQKIIIDFSLCKDNDVNKLAKFYGVSTSTIRRRKENL